MGVKEVILILKLTVPLPLVIFVFEVVGLVEVPKTIPLSVIVTPPSLLIVPPVVTVVWVMPDTSVVIKVGTETGNVERIFHYHNPFQYYW